MSQDFKFVGVPKPRPKRRKWLTAAELGAIGGATTARLYGSEYMSEIGKRGMQKRWGDRIKPPVEVEERRRPWPPPEKDEEGS